MKGSKCGSMKPNYAFMTFCSGAQKCSSLESKAGKTAAESIAENAAI